jgi:hypothetical protein
VTFKYIHAIAEKFPNNPNLEDLRLLAIELNIKAGDFKSALVDIARLQSEYNSQIFGSKKRLYEISFSAAVNLFNVCNSIEIEFAHSNHCIAYHLET